MSISSPISTGPWFFRAGKVFLGAVTGPSHFAWNFDCNCENNFRIKYFFCGNHTGAQTSTDSSLSEPGSPVQIPSLRQGKVGVPFPLIVFSKLRFCSLHCYFHLSIWLWREETRCCVTNHSYLQSVGILIKLYRGSFPDNRSCNHWRTCITWSPRCPIEDCGSIHVPQLNTHHGHLWGCLWWEIRGAWKYLEKYLELASSIHRHVNFQFHQNPRCCCSVKLEISSCFFIIIRVRGAQNLAEVYPAAERSNFVYWIIIPNK